MKVSDELDIALSLVDGVLDRGVAGYRGPVKRWSNTLLICDPFLDMWGGLDAILIRCDPEHASVPGLTLMSQGPDGSLTLGRISAVSPKALRKAGVPFRSRDIYRDQCVFVDQRGHAIHRPGGYDLFHQRIGPMRWATAHARANRIPEYSAETSGRVQVAIGLMSELYYHWTVEFIGQSGSSFMMPTTGEGAREMFRDRDRPEGKSRRAALRHWVSAHSRMIRSDKRVDVRGHLRCGEPFSWRGYTCRLRASQLDTERAKA